MQLAALTGLLEGFHTTRILVVGDVMLDRFVYGTVERISPEAPIPVVSVERIMDMPGGAANVARNIAALGARVILLGVVGDDAPARDLRQQLAASPTIESCLVSDSSRPTSLKTRYIADGQQVMRADRESRLPLNASIGMQVLDAFAAALGNVAVVVLSDYAKGVLSDTVTRAALDLARSAGKTVVVDPKAKDFGRYRGATILTPNRQELQMACGRDCLTDSDVALGAQAILDQGICDVMVVTRGKDGMSVVRRDREVIHLPTSARQVFDVSGAGDTVAATLSLGIAAGGDIVQAATLANLAAGLVVGKRGTATVTAGEIVTTLEPAAPRVDPQKIFSLDNVLQLARGWREQGLKIAFANGCFDLLHPGHISLLDQARRSADRLIVGLNSDLSIRRLKGPNRPVQGEVARATVLAAVKSVDAVVIFADDTPLSLINALEPDVLVKGADYTVANVVGADWVLKRGGKVLLADLLDGHSTSETVRRVVESPWRVPDRGADADAGGSRDKVVVLDRDGTIVIDRGYLADPAGLEFEPSAADGLRWFQAHGFRLVVVTNQSGVGRGYFPLQRVLDMNARLNDMAKEIGVTFEAIYMCPHAPDTGCDCRKPAVGLMRRAAVELGFDPAHAVVIGDKQSDIEFGRRVGATTILIAATATAAATATTAPVPSSAMAADTAAVGDAMAPDYVARNLMEAARAVAALCGVTASRGVAE